MTLVKLNLARLQHVELGQMVIRFLDDLDKSQISYQSEEHLSKMIETLRNNVGVFRIAIKPIRTNQKTQLLAEADKKRGQNFRALYEIIKAYRFSINEQEAEAYSSLFSLLKTYKDTQNKNYEAETLLLSKLLEKLNSSPYQTQVNLLNIQNFVSKLATSNQEFEEIFAERSKEKLSLVTYDSKTLRTELCSSYTLMVDYIRIMADTKSNPLYDELLKIINNSRHYYADLISKRIKTNKTTNHLTNSENSSPESE